MPAFQLTHRNYVNNAEYSIVSEYSLHPSPDTRNYFHAVHGKH